MGGGTVGMSDERRSRAFPPSVKAARAITRALDGLSSEDRLEAVLIAFPESDPSVIHARQRMAIEAVLSLIIHATSTQTAMTVSRRILEKALNGRAGEL